MKNYILSSLTKNVLFSMFNDEIEEIRLKAIDCMTKISRLIVLREDQLEIILGVLEVKVLTNQLFFTWLINR